MDQSHDQLRRSQLQARWLQARGLLDEEAVSESLSRLRDAESSDDLCDLLAAEGRLESDALDVAREASRRALNLEAKARAAAEFEVKEARDAAADESGDAAPAPGEPLPPGANETRTAAAEDFMATIVLRESLLSEDEALQRAIELGLLTESQARRAADILPEFLGRSAPAPAADPRASGGFPAVDPRASGGYAAVDPRASGGFPAVDPRASGGFPAVDPRASGGYAAVPRSASSEFPQPNTGGPITGEMSAEEAARASAPTRTIARPSSSELGLSSQLEAGFASTAADDDEPTMALRDSDDEATVVAPENSPSDTERVTTPFRRSDFENYEIDGAVSRGAMGQILRARDRRSGDTVALKVLIGAGTTESDITRFRLEATTLIRLKHPHIVNIHDFGCDDGRLFIAMELVQGATLESLVRSSLRDRARVPPWRQTVEWMLGIARALAYCHEQSVIHRDVKPSNILVEAESNRAILVDFGIGKQDRASSEESDEALTKSDDVLGTPAYMSPEQLLPGGRFGVVGAPSDVWGFASTLFFALTGTPPFHASSLAEMLNGLMHRPVPRARERAPDIPVWLDDLLSACLTKDSRLRPGMAEVVTALEDGLRAERPLSRYTAGSPALALVGMSLISAVLLGFMFLTRRPELLFATMLGEGLISARDHATVVGRVRPPKTRIEINGQPVPTATDGSFRKTFPLVKGANSFELRLPELEDQEPIRFERLYDPDPPVIVVTSPKPEAGRVVFERAGRMRITGRVEDSYRQVFECRGSPAAAVRSFKSDGSFVIEVEDVPEPFELTLFATDQSGHSDEYQLIVSTPRALLRSRQSERRRLERERRERTRREFLAWLSERRTPAGEIPLYLPLRDSASWRDASTLERRRSLEFFASRLEPDFQILGRETITVGALQLEIGVFRHVPTEQELVLVPGGLVATSVWSGPGQEVDWRLARAMISDTDKPINIEVLEDVMAHALLPSLNRLLESEPALRSSPGESIDVRIRRVRAALVRDPELAGRLRRALETLASQAGEPREVTVYQAPFLLGRFEVSRGAFSKRSSRETFELPMTGREFASVRGWLGQQPGALRLPTRLEFLHAATSGLGPEGPTGARQHRGIRPEPTPGEERRRRGNLFGLVDLCGNAEEWVEPDWWIWPIAWPRATDSSPILGRDRDYWLRQAAVVGGHSGLTRELCSPLMVHYAERTQGLATAGFRVARSLP